MASSSVTLTYGRDESGSSDHWHARSLVLSDVKNYIKRIRAAGYPVRYLVAGEYGSRKGRSHWHLLLFWTKQKPAFQAGEVLHGEVMKDGDPYPVGKSFDQRFWKLGRSHWSDFGYKEIKYVVKYILKEADKPRELRRYSWSRKPVLGAKRLEELAGEYVDQGLVPNVPNYHFLDVRKRSKRGGDGGMIDFRLAGASLAIFVQSFLTQWYARYGRHPPRAAASSKDLQGGAAVKGLDRDWLIDWLDSNHMKSSEEVLAWEPDVARVRLPNARPEIDPPGGEAILYSVGGKCYYYDAPDGVRMFWSFNERGKRQWRSVMVSEAEGQRRSGLSAAREELAEERAATPQSYRRAKSGDN